MHLVDDDRDESGGEMRFAKRPVEATSFLHKLFGTRNHNAVRPVLDILLVLRVRLDVAGKHFTSKTRGVSAIVSVSTLMALIRTSQRSAACWSPRRVRGETIIKIPDGLASNGIQKPSVFPIPYPA